MANQINRFNRSMEKWRGLKTDGHLSAPTSMGQVAIMYDRVPPEAADRTTNFHEMEAIEIKKYHVSLARTAFVLDSLSDEAFTAVLQNDLISDIVIIGHGTFGAVDKGYSESGYFDWYRAGQATNHLKTGHLVQRTCGGISHRSLAVPFGMFVVDDHRNIHMPFRTFFSPEAFGDSEEAKIKPITDETPIKLSTILEWQRTTDAS